MAKRVKLNRSAKVQKNAEKSRSTATTMSLMERIKWEKETWKSPHPRIVAKEALRVWLSIPAIFLGAPDQVISKLGIEERDVIDIMKVGTQRAFAELVGVQEQVVSEWKRELTKDHDSFAETKAFMKRLTKNVLGSLYRAALSEGDAPRAKLWMQIVESWREQMGIEHSGDVGGGLTDEERAALDKLIAKNTA